MAKARRAKSKHEEKETERGQGKKFGKVVLILLLLIVIAGFGTFLWYNISLGETGKSNEQVTFEIPMGSGADSIATILKENNVIATFFLTAHYLNTQPELVKQMIDEGHIVGNHTVNHKSMPSLTEEQINSEVMELHKSIYEKFQYEMKYIRPPMGEFSERSLNTIRSLGYKTVMWSFAYDDWDEAKQGREAYGKKKILDNLHNGEVMLLHGTSKDNGNILDECIKEIKKQGYEFKSLDEFVG